MIMKVFSTHRQFFPKFWSKRLLHLEQEISAWLEANSGVRITDIKQSCSGGFLEQPRVVISIWYEAKG